jgi:hypothetical protein
MKRTALRRKPRRDPVPDWLRPYVGSRDLAVGGCVMAHLDPEHRCRDTFGNRIPADGQWEMDHIDNGGVGRRVHEKWNVVRLCPAAHADKTMHAKKWRPELRRYAWGVEGKVAA